MKPSMWIIHNSQETANIATKKNYIKIKYFSNYTSFKDILMHTSILRPGVNKQTS